LSLRSREYMVSLKGVEISRYELPQGCELAISTGAGSSALEGQATREPAFGMAALWIPAERADRARNSGYTVVDTVSVLGTHLAELIRRHAHELDVLEWTRGMVPLVLLLRPGDGEHLVRQVDAEHAARADLRRHEMRDQAGAGADVQDVLVLDRGREVDQPHSDPAVLASCPRVIERRDPVEEVDHVVDHLMRGIRVHQRHDLQVNLWGRFRTRLLRC